MTKTSAELEREVEAARGRVDQTVEALKDKMQPRELVDEATRIMSGTSNRVLTTAVEQLRENPIPIALIGLGIAWLAINQTRRRSAGDAYAPGYYETYEGYDEGEGARARLKARVDQAKEKLAGAADRAKESLAKARTGAADGAELARGRAAELAETARAKAGEYSRAARRRFDDTLETEPLVIGAIGLAVGAAIGAALPSTPIERRYVGPARDKAAEKAKASLDEARDVARRAYSQVKEELHRQTGPAGEGASLREKAESVASAGAQAVRDDLERGAPH
jgi:ElaB/YqjD/DUF883 family membrane-anchored ribosome-binding protein